MNQNLSKEVTVKNEENNTNTLTQAQTIDFAKYFSETTRPHFRDSDLIIPQIQIINAKNRFLQDDENKVENAEIGMMINTVSEELYHGTPGIGIIPCVWRTGYEEYTNERKSKYVATHMDDPETLSNPIRKSAEWIDKQLITKEGTLLKLIHKYYVIYWDLENDADISNPQQAVIKFKSFSIQSGAKYMNSKIQIMMARRVPMFGLQFQLSLYEKHTDNGDFWYYKSKYMQTVAKKEVFEFAMVTAKTIGEGLFVEDDQESAEDHSEDNLRNSNDGLDDIFGV